MVYARAHDQNVAEDYFSAMSRVEQRLNIVPGHDVEEGGQVLVWIERLALPELGYGERLEIARGLRQALVSSTSTSVSIPMQMSDY